MKRRRKLYRFDGVAICDVPRSVFYRPGRRRRCYAFQQFRDDEAARRAARGFEARMRRHG